MPTVERDYISRGQAQDGDALSRKQDSLVEQFASRAAEHLACLLNWSRGKASWPHKPGVLRDGGNRESS
jgi:hypothetical protein